MRQLVGACKQGNEFSSHLPVNERIWAYAAGSMIEVAHGLPVLLAGRRVWQCLIVQ
jgi:hypothetical protein